MCSALLHGSSFGERLFYGERTARSPGCIEALLIQLSARKSLIALVGLLVGRPGGGGAAPVQGLGGTPQPGGPLWLLDDCCESGETCQAFGHPSYDLQLLELGGRLPKQGPSLDDRAAAQSHQPQIMQQ